MAQSPLRKPARYLVELSLPEAGWQDIDHLIRRARYSADGSANNVRFVRAIFVPEDGSCYLLLEGASAQAVKEAGRLAGLPFGAVSETLSVPAGGDDPSSKIGRDP
jgi:hypothetical protein